MQIRGHTIRNQVFFSLADVWETAKGWARTYITREAMFDAALILATFGCFGFVLLSLHRVFEHYTVTGF